MDPRAVGLGAGFVADALLGDPRRGHPVAAYGAVAARLEKVTYADSRLAGVVHVAVLVGGCAAAGYAVERATSGRPLLRALTTGAATWAVLGGRSLVRESSGVARALLTDDLPDARVRLRALVSRDPTALDEAACARAAVESVAENTSDAVTAPLVWGAVAGVPGLLAYRALNTLDAMVGYRNDRYRAFGWAAARLDDAANYVPARLAAVLTLAVAPWVGGRAADGRLAVRRDAPAHPSPNGGVIEAAFAGVLGVRLGGANTYGGHVEDRGELGDGAPPTPRDVARANRLSLLVQAGSGAAAVGIAALVGGLRGGRGRRPTTSR